VRDLSIENLTLLSPASAVVIDVKTARGAAVEGEEEEEAEGAAEGGESEEAPKE